MLTVSCTKCIIALKSNQSRDVMLQVIASWENNKLVMKYEPKEADSAGKAQTHTRELDGEELILVESCSQCN